MSLLNIIEEDCPEEHVDCLDIEKPEDCEEAINSLRFSIGKEEFAKRVSDLDEDAKKLVDEYLGLPNELRIKYRSLMVSLGIAQLLRE
jgi:hypothetical protein